MYSSLNKNPAHHLFPNHKPSRPRTLGFAEFHAAHFPPHVPFFRSLVNPYNNGSYPNNSWSQGGNQQTEEYFNTHNDYEEELASSEETGEVEEVSFQLSEETIAMFAFSARHRIERDAEKLMEAKAQRKEEEEALTVALNSLPTMTFNDTSSEDYFNLYGLSGSKIAVLEATLNHEYEKGCSEKGRKAPSLWPVLPLRL